MRVYRVVAIILGLAWFCPRGISAGDEARGQELFKTCGGCHVIDSDRRKMGPSLRSLFGKVTLRNGKRVTEENVRELVLDGYNQMPPFRYNLTASQTDDLMAFLKTLKGKPVEVESTSAAAGFNAYCMSCHNPELHGERGPVLRGLFAKEKLANGEAVSEKSVRALIDDGHAKAPAFKEWLDDGARKQIVEFLKTY
jgi:cytochrome c2